MKNAVKIYIAGLALLAIVTILYTVVRLILNP